MEVKSQGPTIHPDQPQPQSEDASHQSMEQHSESLIYLGDGTVLRIAEARNPVLLHCPPAWSTARIDPVHRLSGDHVHHLSLTLTVIVPPRLCLAMRCMSTSRKHDMTTRLGMRRRHGNLHVAAEIV